MMFSVELVTVLIVGAIVLVAASVTALLVLWLRDAIKGELW